MKNLAFLLLYCLLNFSADAQQWRLQKILSTQNGVSTGIRTFFYSGNRGSDHKNNILNYDVSYSYNGQWIEETKQTQQYDTANRQVYYTEHTSIPSNQFYKRYYRSTDYNTKGQVIKRNISDFESKKGTIVTSYEYEYDTTGLLISAYDTSHNTYISYGSYRSQYFYDTAHNLILTLQRIYSADSVRHIDYKKNKLYIYFQ